MFEWFRKKNTKVNPEVPDTVRWYMTALEPHLNEAFVSNHFHQVTWFTLVHTGTLTDFYALEFRAGNRAAFIWAVGSERWHIGKYISLAHEGADVTCEPSALTPDYWAERQTVASLSDALEFLQAATPPPYLRTGKTISNNE